MGTIGQFLNKLHCENMTRDTAIGVFCYGVFLMLCMLTYCIQNSIIDLVKNMNITEVFASNLKFYRNKIGISQTEFADKAGLHRTYISAIECGKRSISLDNIQKIAEALEIEAYLLFIDNKEKQESKKAGGKI